MYIKNRISAAAFQSSVTGTIESKKNTVTLFRSKLVSDFI